MLEYTVAMAGGPLVNRRIQYGVSIALGIFISQMPLAAQQQRNVRPGHYDMVSKGGRIEVRVEGDLRVSLYDQDGSQLAALRRKKVSDPFKGETLTQAEGCPNGRGRVELHVLADGRVKLKIEKPNRLSDTPICMVPLIPATWNEIDLGFAAQPGSAGATAEENRAPRPASAVASASPVIAPAANAASRQSSAESILQADNEDPVTGKLLAEWKRFAPQARRGSLPQDPSDPFLLHLLSILTPDGNRLVKMQAVSDFLEKVQLVSAGANSSTPNDRRANYGVLALSTLLAVCGSDALCLKVAWGAIIHEKGSFAEVISHRPRSFLTGGSIADKQSVANAQNMRSTLDNAIASAYGEDILTFQGEARGKEMQRRLNAMTPEQQMEVTVKIMQSKGMSSFQRAMGPDVESWMKASKGEPVSLDFLSKLASGEVWVDFYRYRPDEGRSFGAPAYLMVVAEGPQSIRFVPLGPAGDLEAAIRTVSRFCSDEHSYRGAVGATSNLALGAYGSRTA